MNRTFGFKKRERIVSQKLIDELFTSGQSHSLAAFPLRAVFLQKKQATGCDGEAGMAEGNAEAVVLISVPKRRFKHAVDRNRVKRQVREAYRLNRPILISQMPRGLRLAIAFIWLSDELQPSSLVEAKVKSLLKRMGKAVAATSDDSRSDL